MAFASGTFSLAAGNPVTTATTISSSWANTTLSDIATGLSTCVLKDGTQTMTANLPMSSFKITGLAAGSALTDAANISNLQNQFGSYLTAVSGTNTITATAAPIPVYAIGQRFTFIPAVTNTGATTLNVSSVGAGAVQWVGAALTGGELVVGRPVTVLVTAATPVFEIIAPTQFPDTRALVIGGTDATKKLRIEVDGITTATTRVWTARDADFDIGAATQAEQETGTALTASVVPGRQQFHPSAAKFWAFVTITTGTPTLAANYNVSGIVDDGPGILTVTIGTDFSSALWCPGVSGGSISSASTTYGFGVEAVAAGSVQVICQRADGTDTDLDRWGVWGFGDQA